MIFDYKIYEVTVTPLTPLHIGSGRLLLNEYDYAIYEKFTWRIDEDAFISAQQEAQNVTDMRLAEKLAKIAPAQLLTPADYKPGSNLFRYRLTGTPRAKGAGAQLQEMVKTVTDEAYLPGSSLKGAIRTALAWHGWAEKRLQPDTRDLDRDRRFAGRWIEKQIMGPDPNHDLLRALHVSDSDPAGKDCFIVLNAQVVTPGSLGSPIELEAVKPDTAFSLTIKIDQQLFSQWAKTNQLQLGGNGAWLNNLPALIQGYTAPRLNQELAWYQNRSGAEQTTGFYRQLIGAKLPPNACLLQLGWGTGWQGKTYGSHLQQDQPFMESIISTYRLAKGKRLAGDPFPKSRRSTVQVVKDKTGQTRQRVGVPLGWVLMEMKEKATA